MLVPRRDTQWVLTSIPRKQKQKKIAKRDLIHASYGNLATLEESHSHTPVREICSEG